MPRKTVRKKKGGCWPFCKTRHVKRAANQVTESVTGRPLVHIGKKEEALLAEEDAETKARERIAHEKELAEARRRKREAEAEAEAAEAETRRLRRERETAEVEANGHEKEAAKYERQEEVARAALAKAEEKLKTSAEEDRGVYEQIVREMKREVMSAKGEKKKHATAAEGIRKKLQGGRRSTRRRKSHRRR